MIKIEVTFLLDKNNNWIERFLINSNLISGNDLYNIKKSHNHLEVQGQDIVFILRYTKILDDDFSF